MSDHNHSWNFSSKLALASRGPGTPGTPIENDMFTTLSAHATRVPGEDIKATVSCNHAMEHPADDPLLEVNVNVSFEGEYCTTAVYLSEDLARDLLEQLGEHLEEIDKCRTP